METAELRKDYEPAEFSRKLATFFEKLNEPTDQLEGELVRFWRMHRNSARASFLSKES